MSARAPLERNAPGAGAGGTLLCGQAAVLTAVAFGGVIGAEARYGIGVALPRAATGFPLATLVINTVGCALIGVLMVLITEVVAAPRLLRPFAGVGVLGGFTTFSGYTVEALALLEAHRPGLAVAYLVATPAAALAAVWLGSSATRGGARRLRRAGRG